MLPCRILIVTNIACRYLTPAPYNLQYRSNSTMLIFTRREGLTSCWRKCSDSMCNRLGPTECSPAKSLLSYHTQIRTLYPGTRWGNTLLRRTRVMYESPPPDVPTTETFSKEDLSRLRYSRVVVQPPVWISRRSPLIGYKVGVMPLWDEWGQQHTCTVVKMDRLVVMEEHNKSKHGREGMRLGLGVKFVNDSNKSQIGEAMKLGIAVKDVIKSTKCSSDCVLPLGFRPSVRHFCPGQYVMVGGTSQKKPFQGAIARWRFSPGRKGHHFSRKVRRSRGASGAGGDKIVKRNLKMAGHGGGVPCTTMARVFRIETYRNLLFLAGLTPGLPGSLVTVWDARGVGWARNKDLDIKWPTFIPEVDIEYPVTQQAPPSTRDPFLYPDRPFNDQRK